MALVGCASDLNIKYTPDQLSLSPLSSNDGIGLPHMSNKVLEVDDFGRAMSYGAY